MSAHKHTPGPWRVSGSQPGMIIDAADRPIARTQYPGKKPRAVGNCSANARLIAAAPELLEALHEGRRAIGDHHAPNDCYATGPLTGDDFRDLVQCPACSFIAMYDAAIARATGEAP